MTALADVDIADARKEFYVYVGLHVKHYREYLGWTQTELANEAGCSTQSVSAWENATKVLGVFDLMMLSVALEVPVTALLPRGAA